MSIVNSLYVVVYNNSNMPYNITDTLHRKMLILLSFKLQIGVKQFRFKEIEKFSPFIKETKIALLSNAIHVFPCSTSTEEINFYLSSQIKTQSHACNINQVYCCHYFPIEKVL